VAAAVPAATPGYDWFTNLKHRGFKLVARLLVQPEVIRPTSH
jgi:hypothetical protein